MPSSGETSLTQAQNAVQVVMDLISRREHSALELKEKLKQQEFSSEEIEQALQKAYEKKWLARPEDAAQDLAVQLHKKNKGIEFINSTLEQKGLPAVSRDEDLELEKALSLVKTKYAAIDDLSPDKKIKAMRFLASRGFDTSTIRKVFHDQEF